jgi:integrase
MKKSQENDMARQVGNKWIGDAVVNGSRQRRRFSSLAEAEAFEGKSLAVVSETSVEAVVQRTFLKYWKGTKDERMATSLTKWLVDHFGGDTPITSITTASVMDMVDFLREEEGLSPGTINRRLAKLSKIMGYAVDKDYVQKAPKIEFLKEGRGRTRFLTPDEEQRVFDALPDKYRVYAVFLLYTGCRVSEAIKLQWQDIHQGRVTFWDTKNGKPRTVPLHQRAQASLQFTQGEGWIKPFGLINYDAFHLAWTKAKAKAGLAKDAQVVPHVLRHTCASRMAQAGVDLYRIMEWLGHSSITVTKRYAHLMPHNLDAALSALEGK